MQEAIALEDGDVLHIKGGGWGIFNTAAGAGEAAVSRVMQKLEGKLEGIQKGPYAHFMLKEIWEQPESLAATMAGRVKRVPLPSCRPPLHRCGPKSVWTNAEAKIS